LTSRVCIKSHLPSFEYWVKINCDFRTRSILTDAIYRKHKECNGTKRIVQLHSQECNGTYSIALLGNGIFYSISRDHKQPIKWSEINKVLYKSIYTAICLAIIWYRSYFHYIAAQLSKNLFLSFCICNIFVWQNFSIKKRW
jgi:hypothetical protein